MKSSIASLLLYRKVLPLLACALVPVHRQFHLAPVAVVVVVVVVAPAAAAGGGGCAAAAAGGGGDVVVDMEDIDVAAALNLLVVFY